MRPLLTAAIVFGTLALVAKSLPQSAGTGGSGVAREALERCRKDQAAVYRNLRRFGNGGQIKNSADFMRYFAFCRTIVERNAFGPLGPELGRLVHTDKFDWPAIDRAAAQIESEFEQ